MDTIAALSSPAGPARRAIVRLSGPRALAIGAALAGVEPPRRRAAVRGRFAACGAEATAVLLAMPGPRSYTREDVAEVHLPGAAPVASEALRRVFAAGAREAAPGEFTRRAVENGRLTLAQAEGVMAVIRARDDAALRAAADRLAGASGSALAAVSGELAALLADVEASIDFIEHDVPCAPRAEIAERIETLRESLVRAAGSAPPDEGALLVVLSGPPGAGKTSLFNALTGGTGLVSGTPGTTRDVREAALALGAVLVRLADAPGDAAWPPGPDADAASRGRSARDRADIVVHVRDGTRPGAPPAFDPARELFVLSKADLGSAKLPGRALRVSSVTGAGIPRLRARIALLVRRASAAGAAALSSRERDVAERAGKSLSAARAAVEGGVAEEFVALELREALDALGEATGPVTPEAILDRVFARFCIGK